MSQSGRRVAWIVGAIAILAAVTGGSWMWKNRVEFFEIPQAWRRYRSLRTGLSDREERHNALTALLRIQVPTLDEPDEYSVQEVRSRDGSTVLLVCFAADGSGTEQSEFRQHLLVNDLGRIVASVVPFFDRHHEFVSHSLVAAPDAPYDLLSIWDAGGTHGPVFHASIDRFGFVPHGYQAQSELRAPINFSLAVSPGESDDVLDLTSLNQKIDDLLASNRAEDALRAMLLMERTDSTRLLAQPLLRSEDPVLRARAASVLGTVEQPTPGLESLLSDPVPAVRLAALHALRYRDDRDDFARSMTDDPHPAVREAAHSILTRSSDRAVARSALTYLYRNRSGLAVGLACERLSSPAAAEELMTWLEEEIPAALETPEVGETVEQLAYEITDLAEEHIRPYVDRIDRLRRLIDASMPPDEPTIPDEFELDANDHVNEPSDLQAEIELLDGILEFLGEGES